jgi:hypothetical protein
VLVVSERRWTLPLIRGVRGSPVWTIDINQLRLTLDLRLGGQKLACVYLGVYSLGADTLRENIPLGFPICSGYSALERQGYHERQRKSGPAAGQTGDIQQLPDVVGRRIQKASESLRKREIPSKLVSSKASGGANPPEGSPGRHADYPRMTCPTSTLDTDENSPERPVTSFRGRYL